MDVHLIDGTYELFRHYYAVPSTRDSNGMEVGAVRGVVASVLGLINRGATHFAVATDHVIESFRNRLWPAYKTSAASSQTCSRSFSRSRMRCRRSASRCGRWGHRPDEGPAVRPKLTEDPFSDPARLCDSAD